MPDALDLAARAIRLRAAQSAEGAVVVEHREALIYLLCQAAELEHALMCEYLFAGFSLKQGTDEGLTPAQLEAVERWRAQLYGIAAQEMLHLALVNNLLGALGAAPHLSRPNLPQRGRHYPDDVWLVLLPFGEQALRHFLYLERPEGMEADDIAAADAHAAALPVLTPDDIVPRGQDFATVGHLYRAIESGFHRLVERYGEEWTFVGPPGAQITGDLFRWPELIPVTDLASACSAVETIIEEGEGARGDWREAHFGRFLRVLDEYLRLRADDPTFSPARPVVAASVRPPADAEPGAAVEDPVTAAVLDVFDVAYEVLLQLLERFFGHSGESPAQLGALADAAVGLMVGVLRPLGEYVTTLPLRPGDSSRAGPSFQLLYATGYLLPHRESAWLLICERLGELVRACDRILATVALAPVAEARSVLAGAAAALARQEPRVAARPARSAP